MGSQGVSGAFQEIWKQRRSGGSQLGKTEPGGRDVPRCGVLGGRSPGRERMMFEKGCRVWVWGALGSSRPLPSREGS